MFDTPTSNMFHFIYKHLISSQLAPLHRLSDEVPFTLWNRFVNESLVVVPTLPLSFPQCEITRMIIEPIW